MRISSLNLETMAMILRAYLNPEIPENYFRGEVNISNFLLTTPSLKRVFFQLYLLRYCGIEVVKDETFWYKIYSYISMFMWVFMVPFLEVYEFYPAWGSDINTLAAIYMYSMTHVNGKNHFLSL